MSFGRSDDELAAMPLTFRDGLFDGQIALVLDAQSEMVPDPLVLAFMLAVRFEERTVTIDVDGIAVDFSGFAAVEVGTEGLKGPHSNRHRDLRPRSRQPCAHRHPPAA